MTRTRIAATLWVCLIVTSCNHMPQRRGVVNPKPFRVLHLPPQSKDMIEAAIAMQSLPLSVSSSCKSVGTESTDATIGRYLSGFLAEFSESADKNWIETAIHPGTANGEAIWTCDVNIRHQNGDDRWGWGVRFNVRQSDGTVLQESLRCIGAG